MLYLLLTLSPFLQEQPPNPSLEIAKYALIFATIVTTAFIGGAAGVLVVLLRIVRDVRKNPDLVAYLENKFGEIIGPEQGHEAAELLRESGELIDELTDDIPASTKGPPPGLIG